MTEKSPAVIAPTVVELLESGASTLLVGTVDADRRPEASRAWGLEAVGPGEGRLRVLMSVGADQALANVDATGNVAVTATDVSTFKSVQAKGRGVVLGEPTDADLARTAAYQEAIAQAIHATDGSPLEALRGMWPAGVIAVEVEVHELFDQTPGPSAGKPIECGS